MHAGLYSDEAFIRENMVGLLFVILFNHENSPELTNLTIATYLKVLLIKLIMIY